MNYKIVDVEGIGNVYAEKLIAAGIESTDALLEKCAKPAGRKELAEATGISPKLILTWANHTDLMRINGVGPQFSELLEAAGVDTVKELQKRFSNSDIDLDLTIETVDRIQGMTVDYAVLYIPGRNPGFALEERRFNVATSRS